MVVYKKTVRANTGIGSRSSNVPQPKIKGNSKIIPDVPAKKALLPPVTAIPSTPTAPSTPSSPTPLRSTPIRTTPIRSVRSTPVRTSESKRKIAPQSTPPLTAATKKTNVLKPEVQRSIFRTPPTFRNEGSPIVAISSPILMSTPPGDAPISPSPIRLSSPLGSPLQRLSSPNNPRTPMPPMRCPSSPNERPPSRWRSPRPSGNRAGMDMPSSPPPVPAKRRGGHVTFENAIRANKREMVLQAAPDSDANCEMCLNGSEWSIGSDGKAIVQNGQKWIMPLLAAARDSTPGVVAALLGVGAVPGAVNLNNQSALHVLCCQPGPDYTASRMDIEEDDAEGRALRERELALSTYILIEAGVDIFQKDISGRVALDYAKYFGHPQVSAVLLEGADSARRSTFERLVLGSSGRSVQKITSQDEGRLRGLTPRARRFAKEFVLPHRLSQENNGGDLEGVGGTSRVGQVGGLVDAASFIGRPATPRKEMAICH